MISAQAERPRRGSGSRSQHVPVDQNVGVRKGVRRNAEQDWFDADALFNADDSYNVDACMALMAKWQGEIDLFDAAAKAGEEYTVKWGGVGKTVRKDFTRSTGCKQRVEGETLTKAPLMRHFIAFLRERIAETQSGDEGSN